MANRLTQRSRFIIFVVLLALPFIAGYLVGQVTGRPSRLYAAAIFSSEAVAYLIFVMSSDLNSGKVTSESYGARKTYPGRRGRIGAQGHIPGEAPSLIGSAAGRVLKSTPA
jgi:hypothetical protein